MGSQHEVSGVIPNFGSQEKGKPNAGWNVVPMRLFLFLDGAILPTQKLPQAESSNMLKQVSGKR